MAFGARDHRLVDRWQVYLRSQAALEPEDARPDLCRCGEISLARTVSGDPAQPHGCAERRRAGPDTVRGREPNLAHAGADESRCRTIGEPLQTLHAGDGSHALVEPF